MYVEDQDCERGYKLDKYVKTYAWVFAYGPMLLVVLVVIATNLCLYVTIRGQERRCIRYATMAGIRQDENYRHRKSKSAAIQSSLYVLASLFSFIWTLMPYVGFHLDANLTWRYFFRFMVCFFYPLQGFFNFFIFIRCVAEILCVLQSPKAEKSFGIFRCASFVLT